MHSYHNVKMATFHHKGANMTLKLLYSCCYKETIFLSLIKGRRTIVRQCIVAVNASRDVIVSLAFDDVVSGAIA